MQYPLKEKIGDPDLLVGREKEFAHFHKWIAGMPRELSKSRAILGRRKSGKTTFVQRLFNEIWSANGQVIPFFYSIPEHKVWYPDFAVSYYCTFATQYISFLERDAAMMRDELLTLEQIKAYGEANSIHTLMRQADSMLYYQGKEQYGLMWETAYRAPHRVAAVYDQRILVIIDEFQYLSTNIYARPDFTDSPIESMPGSYHESSESKVAPMLATGSYVGWMIELMGQYLEAGRLTQIEFSPYLTEEEGLQAVYKYAEAYEEPITNETALYINELCMADPFFISCVIQSNYSGRDLTTQAGVVETVNYEVAHRQSELSGTWKEYIDMTVDRINERYGKHLLLHLSKHNNRYWTPSQLKETLQLDESESVIHRRLLSMVRGDLIEWGTSDIQFRGLRDGTLNLILTHRFEEEIAQHTPDLIPGFNQQIAALQTKVRSLQGRLSDLVGKTAEQYLATKMRTRKRFLLSEFFNDLPTGDPHATRLNLTNVRTRLHIQRADGLNRELDIVAEADDARVLLVEVKKQQRKSGTEDVTAFQEKVALYQKQHPEMVVLAGFLSLGGFTEGALALCREQGIGWSTELSDLTF
ncbi:hypothetical protein KFU94_52325 [Chloroflexi bacterium TSY]|nr:hypothetical protein [Chloroflexi bacterium TSY]